MEELNSCGSVSIFGNRSWEEMESAIGEFWKAWRTIREGGGIKQYKFDWVGKEIDGMRESVPTLSKGLRFLFGTYYIGHLICEQLPITKGGWTMP